MRPILQIFLFLLCLFLLNASVCKAQDTTQSAGSSGIILAVVMPASIEGLDENSVSLMGNKLVNILTNEGVASSDENKNFTLSPTFQIGSVTTTAATLKKLYIANCTFSMFIKQSSTKLVFATYSKLIQGTGFTKEEAVQSAVTSISNDEAGISKFIARGKQKIGAYYQENCQQFMLNADREIAQKHYDAAKGVLEGIPSEAGDCYLNAQKKIGDIFTAQYGSLEKATTYFQAKAVVSPDDEGIKKKLYETKKIAELRNADDKTPPVIALLTPKVSRGQGVEADVKADQIYVSGTATDPSGIASVSVNGQVLEGVRPDGFFQANINSSSTDIVVQAADKKGNAGSQTFHISSKTQETVTTPDEIKPLSDDEKFHAIFLANSNYSGGSWPALNTTVGEAKQLRQLLIDKYGFTPENIDTVFNKNKIDMLTAISNVMAKLGDHDNLIVFYGGHGYFTEATNIAYWVPLGAGRDFEYISNTEITNLIANCAARHILIMADACFSGAMRGGLNSPSKYEYKFKSRQLLTSGGTEPVPGKSAYVQMVLEALKNNEDKYVSARELYTRIAKGIMDQTKTEPTLRDLNVTGSMGGQFYFRKN
jgi:hypothetical protein